MKIDVVSAANVSVAYIVSATLRNERNYTIRNFFSEKFADGRNILYYFFQFPRCTFFQYFFLQPSTCLIIYFLGKNINTKTDHLFPIHIFFTCRKDFRTLGKKETATDLRVWPTSAS